MRLDVCDAILQISVGMGRANMNGGGYMIEGDTRALYTAIANRDAHTLRTRFGIHETTVNRILNEPRYHANFLCASAGIRNEYDRIKKISDDQTLWETRIYNSDLNGVLQAAEEHARTGTYINPNVTGSLSERDENRYHAYHTIINFAERDNSINYYQNGVTRYRDNANNLLRTNDFYENFSQTYDNNQAGRQQMNAHAAWFGMELYHLVGDQGLTQEAFGQLASRFQRLRERMDGIDNDPAILNTDRMARKQALLTEIGGQNFDPAFMQAFMRDSRVRNLVTRQLTCMNGQYNEFRFASTRAGGNGRVQDSDVRCVTLGLLAYSDRPDESAPVNLPSFLTNNGRRTVQFIQAEMEEGLFTPDPAAQPQAPPREFVQLGTHTQSSFQVQSSFDSNTFTLARGFDTPSVSPYPTTPTFGDRGPRSHETVAPSPTQFAAVHRPSTLSMSLS